MAASEFCISMSALVRSILRLLIVLDPLKQISADLNKAKEVLALIHVGDLFFVKIYNNFVSSLLELLIFLAKA